MADATYKVFYTTSDKINTIDVSPGQLLFCEDNRSVYFDNANNQRICYALVVDLETDLQRTSLGHPYNAIYFVEETGILWKYTDKWVQLTGEASQQIVFASRSDFPAFGISKRLYIDGLDIYRWKNGSYQLMNSKHDEWGNIPTV